MSPIFQVPGYNLPPKDWKTELVQEIGSGRMLPLIGNVLINELAFGSHQDMIRQLMDDPQYPFGPADELARRFQYVYIMSRQGGAGEQEAYRAYLRFLENRLAELVGDTRWSVLKQESKYSSMTVSEKAEFINCLSYEKTNALVRLASLPLPIYVTTNCHNFLEVALAKERKRPRKEFCRWNEHLRILPALIDFRERQYEPSVEEPLVFHLHGIDEYPESLVLTEDDHFDFIAAVMRNKEIIPVRIREALANWSLLLLGFDLRGWDFKVVYRSLIKPRDVVLRKKSVSIQLSSDSLATQEYLEAYLRLDTAFDVLWGSFGSFLEELWQAWIDAEAAEESVY